MKKVMVAVVLSAATVLGGCAQQGLYGTSYSRSQVGQAQSVQYGTVESVTAVRIEGRADGVVGSGTGAIVGGIAGNQIGGGSGRTLATVVGAVAGGLIGQRVEQATTQRQGQEITVRLDSGRIVSVVQEVENGQFFNPGDRIRMLGQGSSLKVTY
ncbi:MAG: glycine zipper 2TM domain-containing protein [Oceanospirillales bacterium]|uniref:Outer membrane lipoprotein SlyB n=1 Tax=Marinobacterium halophilum TaxID=267374 RepID=A0A2P8F292_9GAMM|nr:glycine zipper 2TM domain-containing protein [Marinobacterium halophilum]MBR9827964.1 glycine zipper 2TM domain-containing protein [Oceanospirillales bacterium]PSL15830.1 outer membrane lipoprotein SlyB [Marinobacterium halophilum]